MRKNNKFLVSSIIFSLIASVALPYITSCLPTFSGYGSNVWGGFFFPHIPSDIYNIYKNPNYGDSPLQTLSGELDNYEGVANTLSVVEFAELDNNSNSFSIISTTPANDRTVFMYLDTVHNWEGTYLSVSVNSLRDQRMWITNPSLSSSTGWSVNEDDFVSNNDMTATFGYTWQGQSSLQLAMNSRVMGSYRGYDTGDTIEAYQVININRSTVRNAWISFNYGCPNGNLQTNDQGLQIEIDGTRVWYKGYAAIKNEGSDTWHSTGLTPISTSAITIGDGQLDVRISHTVDAGWAYGGSPYWQYVYVYDFYLVLETDCSTTQVALDFTVGSDTVNLNDDGWGQGSGTLDPATNWNNDPVNVVFSTNFNPTTYTGINQYVSLTADLNLISTVTDNTYIEYGSTTIGTSFSVTDENPVIYTTFFNLFLPNNYDNANFTVTKPSDWTVQNVLDPVGSSTGYGTTSTTLYLTSAQTGDFTGYWTLNFTSANDITNLETFNGAVPTNNFRLGDTVTVTATCSESSGNTHMRLYDPNEQLIAVNDSTSNQFSFDITLNSLEAGLYTAVFFYNNSINYPNKTGVRSVTFNLNHSTVLYSPLSQEQIVLQGDTTLLKAIYNDNETGFGAIEDANVTFVIRGWNKPGDKVYNTSDPELTTGGGNYILTFATDASNLGEYNVDVYANKDFYDSRSNTTMFILKVLEDMSLSYTDVPVIPYGTNMTIEIYAENSTGPLQNGIISSNLSIINYNENPAGTYTIDLQTDTMGVGQYVVSISVNKSYHYNKTLNIPFNIRNITADFTYTPPGQIHWSDTVNATIILYYQDLDNGVGITGAFINLTDWADTDPSQDYYFERNTNYTVIEVGNGEYRVEFKMNNLNDSTGYNKYTFNFSASKTNYNTRTLSKVNMTIVPTSTRLDSPDYPSSIIPQGLYNITIEYWDLDNVILIENNTPANPVIIKYQWDNATLQANSVLKPAVDGNYWELEINTTNFDLNTQYNLTINATKQHYDFAEMNLTISLRKNIAVIGVTYPEATVWAENVSFYCSYTDQLGNSKIDIATIELFWYNESSMWEPFPSGWWNITIQDVPEFNTNGNDAKIALNTSALNLPDQGYHNLNLTISAPDYDTRYATLRMYVRAIDAQIFYESPPIERYGDNSTFHITYQDVFHDEIINSSNTVIYVDLDPSTSTLDGNGYYNWSRDLENGNYLLSINTTYWGTAGTFQIEVFANWSVPPYYENVSIQFLFTVRNGSTEILYIPPGSIAWGFNITSLKIQFHDTDTDTYPNITAPDTIVYINSSTTWYEMIIGPDGSNYYTLGNVYTENLEIGNHYLNITIIKTHYDPAKRIIPITIRRHNTELLYLPPGQIPWGTNASIQIWYHDVDTDTYPIMDMTSSLELSISGSSVDYGSTTRSGDYYWINDVKLDDRALGTYQLNITVTNSSDKYDTAIAICPITIRNVSTSLAYTPPGIVPYSATENATFNIVYEDEFGLGIDSATVNLTLLYENENPTNIAFIYNVNWTYYYQGSGTYTIHIKIQNLSAANTKYTFKVDVNKTNYVSKTLSSVNMTIRSTYTQLWSPQAPSTILPLGEYNITIYYEDRENGVRINNGTSPPYVNMTYTWDNDTLNSADRCKLIQVGTSDTYWELWINTTGFDISLTYTVTITANKTYYEHQELNISIQLRKNQPIMGITPPEGTVWGENVTFQITYTTLEGNYIPNTIIDMDWYKAATPYFTSVDLGDGTFNITLDTSAKVLPTSGYYMVSVNCSESTGTYELITQQFKLNVRAIDTQILYQAPQVTPYRDNVTFTIEYRDIFHDVSIDDDNVTIELDLNTSSPGKQGTGFYNWSRSSPNYAITINTTYWSQIGTYPFIVYANWSFSGGENEPYYANTSIEIDLNIRNRSAQLLYTPIGSIPWGQNVSVVIDYYDIDSSSYIPIPNNASLRVSIDGAPVSFDYVVESSSWTITNINVSKLSVGEYTITTVINNTHYSDASQNIPLTIRKHGAELSYTPPESIPWSNNITTLQITFKDTDLNSYPLINMNDSSVLQLNGTSIAHGIVTFSENVYTIYDIDTDDWEIGNYILNVTVYNSSYNKKSIYIPIEIRSRRVSLTGIRPNPVAFGNNVTINVYLKDIDDPSEPGLNFTSLEMEINLLNDSNYNWIPTIASWYYGTSAGEYIIEFDTTYLQTIGDFNFSVQINYTNQQHFENSSFDTIITTRYRDTLITYDSPITSYYGDNVSITLYYWDLDGESAQELIVGGGVNVFQPGVYDVSIPGVYQVIVNTSEFMTENRLSVHQVNVSIYWIGQPYYNNVSTNISLVCRQIETYRDVYIQKGVTEGESVSGYPWGEPGVNITIEYIGYEGIYNNIPINNSNIDIELPAPYNDPANYKIYGTDDTGVWIESTNSKSGIFKLFLNGSVPQNNVLYRFNITLYNSTETDEPYKNQSFSFMISFRKPITNIILYYDSYTPWGSNITFNVLYWNVELESNITDASINATVFKIEDPTNNDFWDESNMTTEFGDFTGNISVYFDGIGGYIVEMNTSWTPRNLKFWWSFEANKTEVSEASTQAYVVVRDIRMDIEIVSSPYVVKTDIESSFNITFNLYDRETNSKIQNDTSDPKYENLQFWLHDDYGAGDNHTYWGKDFDYGTFIVTYEPSGEYYNATFYIDKVISDTYVIRIRVNGSHLGGPQIGEEYAEDYRGIILTLENHHTNITINPNEMVDGDLIVPQIPEFEDFNAQNIITYGEDVNVSFFWYDLNSSAWEYGNKNESGVAEPGFVNLTFSCIDNNTKFGGRTGDLLGLYTVYNLYEITLHNDTYKGIYNLEIRTSILKAFYSYEDIVNGGPFGNGTYNFTINIHFENENFETKYLHTSIEIWLHILPINTTLSIDRYVISSITGASQDTQTPVFPFGAPGSYYYFKIILNYSTNTSETIDFTETWSLKIWNGTLWKAWEVGKVQYFPGTLHELKIYTDTVDTENIPWNASGYKNITLLIEFNKTNYISRNLIQTVWLRKHYTQIQWCDDLTKEPIDPLKTNDTTKYFNPAFRIYFRFIDLDNKDPSSVNYSGAEKYITYANVSFSNWSTEWAIIRETTIPGLYELILSARYDVGTYSFIIYANDSSPLGYRNDTFVIFSLTINPANSSFTVLYNSYVFYEYDLFEFNLYFEDEYGNPISDAQISFKVLGTSGMIGIFIPLGNGIFKGQIVNWALPPGTYLVEITATPNSPNYNPSTLTIVIVIKGITQHELFFWGMVGLAGLIGFIAYKQIKWWIFTPYPVKQMVRTRKIIKKGKEISTEPTVRDRKDLFRDHFADQWVIVKIKPPTMVSSEVVAFAKELSDIKRTRITTTEAKALMMELQNQPDLQAADNYLESMMIPPEARRTLLTLAGFIKYKKPEVLDFTILLSEIKGREYSYEDGERLYQKLKGMKPSEADSYLWDTHLISADDRIKLLTTIGISTEKLKKKRRKEIKPLTDKEIKKELRSIPRLTVEDRRELFEKIRVLSPKDQRKFIGNLKSKAEKREIKRRVKVVEKPKIKPLSADQIEKELDKIEGLSDADKKMMKESILLLDPEEQKATLDDLKKQYESKQE
ncbi:MAG: hypothetical protein ACTSO9_00540 [Candidatus Helarchaeota archaeon]